MVPAGQSDWALKTECVQLQSICSSLASPPVREDLVMELARWLSSGSYCLRLASFLPSFCLLSPSLSICISISLLSHLSFLSWSESLYPPSSVNALNLSFSLSLISSLPFLLYLFIFLSLVLPPFTHLPVLFLSISPSFCLAEAIICFPASN